MHERMRQKSADLVKLLNNNIERVSKKLGILNKTLADSENKDKYKIYGDLLMANLYNMKNGQSSVEVIDYYRKNPAFAAAFTVTECTEVLQAI